MLSNRLVENAFFFGLMGVVVYLTWKILVPFLPALALAAIIVTVSYPLYKRVTKRMPRRNETLGALVTTVLVFVIVVLPLLLLTSALLNEAVAVYRIVNAEQIGIEQSLNDAELFVQRYLPEFELNITEYLKQGASFLANNLGAIFAGTASTILLFFIAMIGSFYLFRDGREFTKLLIRISPLPDDQDDVILKKLARSLRAVLTGVVLIAVIQGTLTAVGLWLFGFERAVLLGSVAAFGALIPSVGTSIVFVPTVLYLVFTGQYLTAIGLALWGTLAVGLIDNLLGPYLISRGNALHPFVILISVLGGIAVFGPIGFIIGPMIVTMLMVMLELYAKHVAKPEPQ